MPTRAWPLTERQEHDPGEPEEDAEVAERPRLFLEEQDR